MNQLNLFDQDPLETNQLMSDNQTEIIVSSEVNEIEEFRARLEATPDFPANKTMVSISNMFQQHRKEGRDGFCRAITAEWIVR